MKKANVLLVEDDADIREIAASYLRDEGFDVSEAKDGDEALVFIGGQTGFDVMLIDVRMPGTLDGVEVAERAREAFPDMPILISSGYGAQLPARIAALGPPTSYLPKPYILAEMGEIMTRLSGHGQ